MPFTDGLPLGDVFDGPLPSSFRDLASRFTTSGITSTTFDGGVQHSGTLRSLQTNPVDLGFGELELPGVTAGISFRLALFDSPVGRWHLDIVLDGLSLKLNDLHGADFVKEAGTTPRRLVRRATDTAVVISGEATIRFAKASDDASVIVLFVENRSAADPLAETGAVVQLRCSPPHFFFGTSQFGMTLSQLLFDASETFSPQFIVAQGQTAEWMGFAIAEATFYAPANAIGRGGFSGGVRNLLIGSPRGLQGEFEIQWGRAPLDPSTFVFTQSGHAATGATGSGNTRLVAITASQDESVSLTASFIASQPPEGGSVEDWSATWRWPDGSETTGDSSTGQIAHGQVLRVVPEERISGRPVLRHPEVTFRFVASGEIPEIDVISAGTSVVNAVHVQGPKSDIAALSFRARSTAPSAGTFTWKLGPSGTERTGIDVTIPAIEIEGDSYLVLRETDGSGPARVARLRVQVLEDKPLLVGGEDGVVLAATPTSPLTPAAVEGTYDLPNFHAQAVYTPLLDDAEIDASRHERVHVPDGALALVTIPEGISPPPVHDRHIEIVFEFAKGDALRWGENKPAAVASAGSAAGLHRQLLQWATNYPGAQFLVIGRCDDLGGNPLNINLAHERRDTVLRFFTTVPSGSGLTPIDASRITGWGEQDGQPASVTSSPLDAEESDSQRLILATDDLSGEPLTDRSGWPLTRDTAHASEGPREKFRRVDIYAVGGTPAAGAERLPLAPARAPELRRMLMPGETADPVPAPTSTPEMDYRVKLLAAWDKPTGDGWKDLIPSKAEFEFAWSPDDQPLPTLGGDSVTLEVLTVYGGWRHDDTTGFTRAQLGIRSDGDPEGLIKIDQQNLVAAMALGPVLLSGVDSDTDTFEAAGRIAALAAGTAFAQVDLGGGPLLGTASKAVINTVEATAEIKDVDEVGDDYKISLSSDYTTTLHINTGALGLRTDTEHPVKFRFNNVGIVFDQSKSDFWEKIAVAYPTDALTIEDPGKWEIDGVLGELLRAVETALGTGSLWIETRFAFALSISVVEISEAVVRVTFGPSGAPSFSLRGLVAKVDIPATVKGEGRLRIEDPSGVIKAGIDLEVIPLQLKASAAFAMATITEPEPFTFVNLYAKVQFPVGIPLGPSGAALHGFIGQTVINGERDVADTTDIVAREIGWWRKNPEDKYRPLKDQHALGIGAVVGTLPDASFSLSATGMIVVAFPDPEVIFAVEISILSIPDKTAKEKKEGNSASITGLIVIDDEAVAIAAQARYEIPQVLTVTVPFAAYFPYSGTGTYVRIGSDGEAGRSGEPITLTLLPTTINLQAFAYLMIEEAGLPRLGGRADFSFDGFSIGFGAGAGLEWEAGPIKLSASILLLAGFGTDPLLIKAGIFVKGELDLVVISISARGEIILTYQDGSIWMDGEFCGEVDLFFFSLKGCVTFRIGSPPSLTPPPPPPIASVVMTDRGGRIMGEAREGAGGLQALPIFNLVQMGDKVENTGADPRDNHTVWADTAPVINFRHYIKDGESSTGQFHRAGQPSGELWFGSNRLKYTYRLAAVRLVRDSDSAPVAGTKPLQSAWCTSPARQPGSGGPIVPSGVETLSLKLLDWQPWGWALPMADGGASAPGDPANTIGNLCVPIPRPASSCLFGRDARSAGVNRIRLLRETPPPGPYPSRFTLLGRPGLRLAAGTIEGPALTTLLSGAGGLPLTGAVIDLPSAVAGPTGPLTRGYRLPGVQIAAAGVVVTTSLPWLAEFDRTIRRGRLLLLVCDPRSRRPQQPENCFRFKGLPLGRSFAALDVPGYRLEALDRQRPFTVTDRVDLTNGGGVLGSDTQPDIMVPAPGIMIRPANGARTIDLHMFRSSGFRTSIKWKDVAGNGDLLVEPGEDQGAATIRVEAPAALAEIVIAPEGEMLFLTGICAIGTGAASTCFDFAQVPRDAVAQGRFSHEDVVFTVLDRRIGLRLVDRVDARQEPARRGADSMAELSFPEQGVELHMPELSTTVSLGVWSGAGPVLAIAFDEAGNVIAEAREEAREPVEMHLSGSGIVRVILSGGSNEAVLYRVCRGAARGSGSCFTFGSEPRGGLSKLEQNGTTFTPRAEGELLRLSDVVTDTQPVRPGRDGTVEMTLPQKGLVLTPQAALSGVTLFVVALSAGEALAVAYDSAGNRVAMQGAGGSENTLLRLQLTADQIARVELEFSGKAVLTRVCVADRSNGGVTAPGSDGLPTVVTGVGRVSERWPASVLGTTQSADGSTCRIVAYDQPAAIVDAAGFDLFAPSGLVVTMLALCGVDTSADLAQQQDAAAQADLADAVIDAATADPATPSREVLLEPGDTYRIEVDWQYQAWTSNEDGTDSAPPPDDTAWQAGGTQSYRFRIASQELATTNTQDGLNEFKFDPRDLVRYLGRTEPADGRDVVFTDDPLWVHFSAGHVEALADRYDRELVLEVRRTDPPPQPDEASMDLAVFPVLLELIRVKGPQSVIPLAEQRINIAVFDAPCLPDGPAVGGASLGGRYQLEKNAMYDFNLLAVRKGAPPAARDPVVVNATRFKTSRYADPAEMLGALGFDIAAAAPIPPEEILLGDAITLPSGPLVPSDRDLADALAAIGADTLPLPGDQGRTVTLWRRVGGSYRIAGFLVDAPESMRRVAAVVNGNKAVDSIRCEPDRLLIGGDAFLPVRATLNWTRVLFVAATPVTPVEEDELRFRLKVAPGGTLTGRRVLRSRPLMFDTEGF